MGEAVAVGQVESFDDAGGGAAVELKLKGGTVLLVPREDRRFAHWTTRLQEEQASGDFVYVGYDAASRVVDEILSTHERRVESIGAASDGDRLAVQIFMSPSTHFVRTTRPRYAELRARLEAAVESKQKVLVTTAVTDLEILDARPSPPAN